ncbi:MAG: O-antigen ligase family protein [Chitinophagales bacterium]
MTGQKIKKISNAGDQLFLIGCLLMAVLIPLHKIATTIALTLILLGTIIGSKRKLSNIPCRYLYLLAIVFIMYIILIPGYFVSEFKVYAIDDMRIKLPLLLLPLCFCIKQELPQKSIEKIFTTYIASCTIISAFVLAIFTYNLAANSTLAMNQELLWFTIHHPTYLSVYIVFGAYWLLNNKFNSIFRKRWYLLLSIIFLFSISIILLSSRLGIILLFLVFVGIVLNYFKGVKKMILLLGISFVLFLIVWKVDFINERFDKMIKSFTMPATAVKTYEIDDRAMIWKNSIALIKEKPWTGYGTGDYKEVHLRLKHDLSGFGKGYRLHYNAHNQFLENWLATGISGFIILLLFYVFNFFIAIKKENKTLVFFMLMALVFSLIESILQSQSGNMFLGFFTVLLYNKYFFSK